jgi:hypothetical protein
LLNVPNEDIAFELWLKGKSASKKAGWSLSRSGMKNDVVAR